MPRLNPESEAKIIELYVAGKSAPVVGDETGYSSKTVMKVVRAAGKERNYGPSASRRIGKPVTFTRYANGQDRGGWIWKGRYQGKSISLMESRVMAAKKLGRVLDDDEYVHFLDGDSYNTDAENLYVDKDSRPKWKSKSRMCAFCGELKPWPAAFPREGIQCSSCLGYKKYLRDIRNKYGLTMEQVEEALAQGCQICGTLQCSSGRRLAADHDHSVAPGPDSFRGFLCARHNQGLGYFQDNIQHLQAAIRYLGGVSVPTCRSEMRSHGSIIDGPHGTYVCADCGQNINAPGCHTGPDVASAPTFDTLLNDPTQQLDPEGVVLGAIYEQGPKP